MKKARLFLRLIEYYRKSSFRRRLPVECNFEPSCSAYAKEALEQYGLRKGVALAISRLCRCNEPDATEKKSDPVPEITHAK
ncbi:MAG: alpha-hemolysin [Opitutae bacterium]|nr:alpha-hemolysin [Opitutae bacterium]